MFRTLEIENFRRFKRYELRDLGRVNLLVGGNNSGKTSILEAVQILVSHGNPVPVFKALARRGEYVYVMDDRQAENFEVRRLFHGHEIALSASFSLRGSGELQRSLIARIERRPGTQQSLFDDDSTEVVSSSICLALSWDEDSATRRFLPISDRGGIGRRDYNPFGDYRILHGDQVELALARPVPGGPETADVHFIESSSLSVDEVVRLFDGVALTAEEELVIQSLQLIEPSIERIASVTNGGSPRSGRGGIVVRCRSQKERVPIGSMGDGIWRMLGLILTLVRSQGGCLLVDEIDTGLHYTVLEEMWKLVIEVAQRLDVQVFATTHSSDCWTSLAAVVRDTQADDVSIQRIEPDAQQAVAFSAAEMVVAAERGIEVR